MIAFFISVLTQNQRGDWYPAIASVFDGLGVGFNWIFSTTDGAGSLPVAMGLLECTPEQLNLIDLAQGVWAFSAEGWTTTRVSQVSVAQRGKLNQLVQDRFPGADIRNTDMLREAFDKLLAARPGSVPTRAALIALWELNYGPLPVSVL